MSLVNEICGSTPENYIKTEPLGSDYIFKNDSSFKEINLYDFFGNGATVNSFAECAHYVEGGWHPFKTTIFDIAIYGLQGMGVLLFAFLIYKLRLFKYIKLIDFKEAFKKVDNFKQIKTLSISIFFALQSFFIFDYVKRKAIRIPTFIDEYISITSNVEFFKNLNFTAGDFLGGSYSIYLTSGPLSAVGSVIGWNLTDKIIFARIMNYYWIFFLHLVFILFMKYQYKLNINYLILSSSFLILLIPWWQGYLYSLGEVASVLIFTNAVFLFYRLRKLSLFLFSLSIFFGKLLTLLSFLGFYLFNLFIEKKIRRVFLDSFFFLIPLVSWLTLVSFRYEDGSFFNYLFSLFDLILNHQSSGATTLDSSNSSSFVQTLLLSEYSNWNLYEKIRTLIVPIVFLFLIFLEKKEINKFFGNISIPLIGAIIFPYIWFWLLSPTKWIRYSQHFTVIIIISIFYFINYEIFKNKISYILSLACLAIFIDDSKMLIYILTFIGIALILLNKESINYKNLKGIIILIITINFTIPYFQNNNSGDINKEIPSCNPTLLSNDCREDYFDF